MPNINKVVFGNQTLIDLSTTTLSSTDQLESGVTAYDRAGNVITGTSTGTGAGGITQDQDGYLVLDDDAPPGTPTLISKTITENGTYDAEDDSADGYSSVTVNVASGGGGLEYEMGTWTPSEDVARPTISFAESHSAPPMAIIMSDATGTALSEANYNTAFAYTDWYRLTGEGAPSTDSTNPRFGAVTYSYRSTTTGSSLATTALVNSSDDLSDTSAYASRYWASPTEFRPSSNSADRSWKAGRTYKWIAVWAPAT